jgi:hypothetical protein
MSNRLEQEFPHISWLAIPPAGPHGLEQDAFSRCIARGHELRSQAVGKSMRVAGAGLARAAVALAAFVRCAAPGLAKLPAKHDPAHDA